MKHRWSSGRILACHAGDPGSIPGRCTVFFFPSFFSFPFFSSRAGEGGGGGGLGLFVSLEIAVYSIIISAKTPLSLLDLITYILHNCLVVLWGGGDGRGVGVGVVSQSKIKIKSTKNTIIAV